MDQPTHSKIVSFLWGIAGDVLRDLFKRGKYPDVILPMCVLRRADSESLADTPKRCFR
jgi:type I restriction enzyme M protein